MLGVTAIQTLDSDDLVPLSMNVSDLIRALSDLCIQAYQQLLSITEKRLQNIIGTVTPGGSVLYPLPFVLLPVSRSSCSAGEREHPGSVSIYGQAGDVQEAFWLGPKAGCW